MSNPQERITALSNEEIEFAVRMTKKMDAREKLTPDESAHMRAKGTQDFHRVVKAIGEACDAEDWFCAYATAEERRVLSGQRHQRRVHRQMEELGL